MGAYDSLKSLVRQYIKTNGQNEITGQILQNVLIAMIDDLGITIDQQPTNGSHNAVSSGGTFDALQQLNEVYDISANHADTIYADLAAALNGGANIPQPLQKGGMSVKFVQSSDNKYVQFRLMSDSFNTTVANWQGVDDEPTAGSNNLVKSGGVYEQTKNSFKIRGNIISLGYTSLAECVDSGIYFYTSGQTAQITDFPSIDDDLGSSNGCLIVNSDYNRIIYDGRGRVFTYDYVRHSWLNKLTNNTEVNATNISFSAKAVRNLINGYLNSELYDKELYKKSGNGNQLIKIPVTYKTGDIIMFGVKSASATSITNIEARYIRHDNVTKVITLCEIGEKYYYVFNESGTSIDYIEFYLTATGASTIEAFVQLLSDDKTNIINELYGEHSSVFKQTQTNNYSQIITGISNKISKIKVLFRQKNLLNPVCRYYMQVTGADSSNPQIAQAYGKNSNIIYVEGLSSLVVSGDFSGFSGRYFRYAFTKEFPEIGSAVLKAGAPAPATSAVIPVPVGAKYMIWSTGSSSIQTISTNVMLNVGVNSMPYEAYIDTFDFVVSGSDGSNPKTLSIIYADEPYYLLPIEGGIKIDCTNSGHYIQIVSTYTVETEKIIGSGADLSVFFGKDSEKALLGSYNVAIGGNNLQKGKGFKNITIGADNMFDNEGVRNTSAGYHSLFRNTTGRDNAAFGAESQDDNTEAYQNTSVGAYSLQRNRLGSNNVAIGYGALKGVDGSEEQGTAPGRKNENNVAIGAGAMMNADTGMDNNIAIGKNAMKNNSTVKGSIVIGNNVDADSDNQLKIGDSTIETVLIAGKLIKFNQDGTVTWETIS